MNKQNVTGHHIEYELKLDSFFYDVKSATTKVILKFRNKRATITLALNELLHDVDKLEALHPIDICVLGVLTNKDHIKAKHIRPTSVVDNFMMVRMSPIIEIIGSKHDGKEELITVRLKHFDKTITTPASDLAKNKHLINAIKYQDALSLGSSLGGDTHFLKSSFIKSGLNYNWSILFQSGVVLVILLLSILVLGTSIPIVFLGGHFDINSEILLLPIIITMLMSLRDKNSKVFFNTIFVTTIVVLIIFVAYFALISHLPYPVGKKYLATLAFNELYNDIAKQLAIYAGAYIVTGIGIVYLHAMIKQRLGGYFPRTLCKILEGIFYVSVFFVTAYLASIIMGRLWLSYSVACYFYATIMVIALIALNKIGTSVFNHIFKK